MGIHVSVRIPRVAMSVEPHSSAQSRVDHQAPWSVLVVARDRASSAPLITALREAGFDVDETANPDSAATLARWRDVVAVAVGPEDLAAGSHLSAPLELIGHVRTAPESAGTSILAWLVAGVAEAGGVHALEAGADAQLSESVDRQLLVATVRALAQRGAVAREQADRGRIAEQAMYKAPVAGILALDEQLNVVAQNDRLRGLEVLGEMVLGRPVQEAIPGELGRELQEISSRALATGEDQHRRVTISTGGEDSHWQLRAFEVSAPSGRVRGLEVVLEDVSEVERVLSELRASEQRWGAVFKSPGIGVSLRDSEARLIECNEAYARIYEAPSAEALKGTDFRDILTREDGEEAQRVFVERWGREPALVGDERVHRLPSGREVAVRATMCNIYDGDGAAVMRLALVTDVTEERRLERELIRAQRMEAIGRLAGGVAHDVNNRLAVIIGYSEIIARRLGAGHELSTHARWPPTCSLSAAGRRSSAGPWCPAMSFPSCATCCAKRCLRRSSWSWRICRRGLWCTATAGSLKRCSLIWWPTPATQCPVRAASRCGRRYCPRRRKPSTAPWRSA
jgi:PAS domain S-box-containing protein